METRQTWVSGGTLALNRLRVRDLRPEPAALPAGTVRNAPEAGFE
jgi:hypothetical protein